MAMNISCKIEKASYNIFFVRAITVKSLYTLRRRRRNEVKSIVSTRCYPVDTIREIFKGDHNAAARKLRRKQISALSGTLNNWDLFLQCYIVSTCFMFIPTEVLKTIATPCAVSIVHQFVNEQQSQ